MGDVDDRLRPTHDQAPEIRSELFPQLGVKVAHRFVEQIDERVAQERPGQGHPLPLSTRQLRGLAIRLIPQADNLKNLIDPLALLRR